ncbi:MAG: M20/M25/M40 family metallo-hydrolase [Planctomycetes bacterium]|nr:M20/M25/M40 family metallo-hydrolase [Planctomycetota bacterium]
MWLNLLAVVAVAGERARAAEPSVISGERIKASVAHLSSDQLEGRAPGTNGEILATEFIADGLEKVGVKPFGAKGTYYQPVPLMKVLTSTQSTLQAIKGSQTINVPVEEGFNGTIHTQQKAEEFEAEAIFMGHGITAPEFGWDDYAGVDVKGKIVLLFTNEPPSEDPKWFGGKAQTYYGRWSYKQEEAARRGAKACFVIHTTETAGYPYSVVRRLDGAQLIRDPSKPALAFAGWLSREAGESLLALAGKTVDEALKEADTKGFKPYSLGFQLKGKMTQEIEQIESRNVVGIVEGSDPVLKSEVVLFTAHWDHLGIGRAVQGDTIYNGAADNATGTALLLELARAWAAQSPKPKRSAVFLAVTAEEKGLLGSKYYARNPLVPLSKTALNMNFDMILPLGVPESVVVTGADQTTIWPIVKAAADKGHLEIEADKRAHLGVFYRSDHFALVQAGVPAFSVGSGTKLKGKSEEFATKAFDDFNSKVYHSPQDQLSPTWDFTCYEVLGPFILDIARNVANADKLPDWIPGAEFKRLPEKKVVTGQ